MWEEVGERLTAQRDALQFKQNELDSIRLEKSNRRRDSIKKVNMVKPDSKDIQVKNDSLLESVSS